jgi:hypothetical protein
MGVKEAFQQAVFRFDKRAVDFFPYGAHNAALPFMKEQAELFEALGGPENLERARASLRALNNRIINADAPGIPESERDESIDAIYAQKDIDVLHSGNKIAIDAAVHVGSVLEKSGFFNGDLARQYAALFQKINGMDAEEEALYHQFTIFADVEGADSAKCQAVLQTLLYRTRHTKGQSPSFHLKRIAEKYPQFRESIILGLIEAQGFAQGREVRYIATCLQDLCNPKPDESVPHSSPT